ncbi:vasa-related protein CnVAS2 [Aphelenchoides avenae]|nr:vasa-related protein CnVAS2 [Aphelenchus avenae]
MSRIRIESLPKGTDEGDLKGLFSKVGNVESARILGGGGGDDSQGIVEFSDEQSVQNAIDQFDNQDFRGQKIRVSAFRGL